MHKFLGFFIIFLNINEYRLEVPPLGFPGEWYVSDTQTRFNSFNANAVEDAGAINKDNATLESRAKLKDIAEDDFFLSAFDSPEEKSDNSNSDRNRIKRSDSLKTPEGDSEANSNNSDNKPLEDRWRVNDGAEGWFLPNSVMKKWIIKETDNELIIAVDDIRDWIDDGSKEGQLVPAGSVKNEMVEKELMIKLLMNVKALVPTKR